MIGFRRRPGLDGEGPLEVLAGRTLADRQRSPERCRVYRGDPRRHAGPVTHVFWVPPRRRQGVVRYAPGSTASGLRWPWRRRAAEHTPCSRLCGGKSTASRIAPCAPAPSCWRRRTSDGRRATHALGVVRRVRTGHPDVNLDRDPISSRRHVYTSAGVTAGMDLALALAKRDFWPAVRAAGGASAGALRPATGRPVAVQRAVGVQAGTAGPLESCKHGSPITE